MSEDRRHVRVRIAPMRLFRWTLWVWDVEARGAHRSWGGITLTRAGAIRRAQSAVEQAQRWTAGLVPSDDHHLD